MVVHTFSLSTLEAEVGRSFEASLIYTESFRPTTVE